MGAALSFRIAGVPIRIHWSFVLMAVVIGGAGVQDASTVMIWVVVVTASILLHEGGHAATFAAFGVPSQIELQALGGLTRPLGGPALTAPRWLSVSLAGPLSGIVLGSLIYLVVQASGGTTPGSEAELVVKAVLYVNVGWSLVNLLPITPLDGGHVLEALLAMTRLRRTDEVAQAVSLVTIVVVGVVATSHGYPLVPIVLGYFWLANAMAWWQRRSHQQDQPLATLLNAAMERLRAGDDAGAELDARAALVQARSPQVRAAAARILALIAVRGGSQQLALEVLGHVGRDLAPDDGLVGALLAVAGRSAEAIPYLYRAYAAHPGDDTGEPLARVLVAAGQPEEAISLVEGPQAAHLGAATETGLIEALLGTGRYADAAALGERAFSRRGTPDIALQTARAWSQAGNPELAETWRQRAEEPGSRDAPSVSAGPAP